MQACDIDTTSCLSIALCRPVGTSWCMLQVESLQLKLHQLHATDVNTFRCEQPRVTPLSTSHPMPSEAAAVLECLQQHACHAALFVKQYGCVHSCTELFRSCACCSSKQ